MLKDITTTINSCKACQLYVPSQKKKTVASLKEATFSFKECAADLVSLHSNDYIVLVDRLTEFLCCEKLCKTSTSESNGLAEAAVKNANICKKNVK